MFGIGIWEIALLKCRDQDSYMHELMIALVKTKQKNLTRRRTANHKIVVHSKWKMEACSSWHTFVVKLLQKLQVNDSIHGKEHFVLVHGIGGGAWFFFEVVTLLKAAGYSASAIDLTANGISKVVADEVVTVVQYTQPLLDFLASIDGQVMTMVTNEKISSSDNYITFCRSSLILHKCASPWCAS